MAIPLDLVLGDVVRRKSVEKLLQHHLDRIELLYDRATHCHVRVDSPRASQRSGRHFEVRIELAVPGDTLVVSEHTGKNDSHEELRVALRDAFEGLERQLTRWKDRRRNEVKTHSGERHRAGALLGAESDEALQIAAEHERFLDESDSP